MITNFGDLLNLPNLGWMFFIFVCALPGLIGVVYALLSLWQAPETKTH